MIVDSHCHLNYFNVEELPVIISNAEANGVKLMQTVCTTLNESTSLMVISENYKQVYFSVGVHPTNSAGGELVSVDELVDLSQHSKVIGLGETGLDFYKCREVAKQEKNFLTHIDASRRTGLPVIIHSRDADKRMIEILESEMKIKPFLGLMHCFASSKELAIKAVELGLYISFSGIVTFKNAKIVQEVACFTPKNRVLVETDSPFLSPEPYRGQKNEPAKTKFVVEYLAQLWDISVEEVSSLTTDNFFRLFSKCSAHFHAL